MLKNNQRKIHDGGLFKINKYEIDALSSVLM